MIERDYNAALNILDEGLRIIGSSTTEFGAKQVCSCSATLVDYPTVDDRCESNLKSGGRLKQEVNNEQNSILFKF